MSQGEAVLYVQRLEVMADFYERALALQRADETGTVRRRSEVPVKFCFVVTSVAAARAQVAAELGGRTSDGEWEFGGYRRTDVVDPEGNVSQLLEACSADAPGA
jgi:hypothetical protein